MQIPAIDPDTFVEFFARVNSPHPGRRTVLSALLLLVDDYAHLSAESRESMAIRLIAMGEVLGDPRLSAVVINRESEGIMVSDRLLIACALADLSRGAYDVQKLAGTVDRIPSRSESDLSPPGSESPPDPPTSPSSE